MQGHWRSVSDAEKSTLAPLSGFSFGHFAPNAAQKALIALCRATILKRGVFRGAMTRLILALGRGALDIRFRGASYRVRGENNLIEYGLLLVPNYNASDLDFLLDAAEPGANFIDVGCNIGLYALPLARACPLGRTVAIDANPLMISRINWNAAASELGNLTVVYSAVSDRDGCGTLMIRKDDVAIVAIEEKTDGEIPVQTLATIVSQSGLTSIHGLKIDIEGHEDRALVPFLDTCDTALLPRRIVIEHPSANADYPGCANAFARHGYRLTMRTRNNSLYILAT